MKRFAIQWFFFVFFGLLSMHICSQQSQLYTQFAFNKLALNPAYAGNNDHFTLTGIYRDQWSGFPGSPKTQNLTINSPRILSNAGLGLNLERFSVGITRIVNISGQYAYKIRMDDLTLSFGLSTTFRNMVRDFTDPRLVALEDINRDGAIIADRLSTYLFNVGTGIYINNERFFAGISTPGLLKTDLILTTDEKESRSPFVRQINFMSGGIIPLSEMIDLTGQFLIRWAEQSSIGVDINAGFLLDNRYRFALSYRSGGSSVDIGESLGLIFGFDIGKRLMIGISYDYTLTGIRQFDQGSLEFLAAYKIIGSGEKGRIANPRYF